MRMRRVCVDYSIRVIEKKKNNKKSLIIFPM